MAKKKILGIDTSTENCSVALCEGDSILWTKTEKGKNKHNRVLAAFIKKILQKTEINITDLDGVAVNIGPGSFTGLRIGLSTAKGLVFPEDTPLLPIQTFSVLKKKTNSSEDRIVFIRSHKNNIYYSLLSDNQNVLDNEVDYGTVDEILEEYKNIHYFQGNYEFEEMQKRGRLEIVYPDASVLCKVARQNYRKLVRRDRENLEPFYLTNFEAKKWKPGIKQKDN